MPIYTTLISGSTGQSFSGSLETAGFVKAIGVGNSSSIDLAVTTPENYNSVLYGPITVAAGGTFTVAVGSNIKIKDISDV